MKSIAKTVLMLTVLLVPAFAFAQGYTQQSTMFFSGGNTFIPGLGTTGMPINCTGNIACAANTIIYIINGVLVPLLFAVAFIVFLYGIAKSYIFSYAEEAERKKGHTLILWGLIAFAVMISIWGLVNVVANTFGLGGYYAPPTPTSVSPYQTQTAPSGGPSQSVQTYIQGTPVGTGTQGNSCPSGQSYSQSLGMCI